MKNFYILLLFAFFISFSGKSHRTTSDNVKNISLVETKTFSSNLSYLDSSFTKGVVVFKNGDVRNGILNYHFINGTIHFIDKDRTIKQLLRIENILYIKYGRRIFTYLPKYGLAELVKTYSNNVELFISRRCNYNSSDGNTNPEASSAALSDKKITYFEYEGKVFNIETVMPRLIDMRTFYLIRINGKCYSIYTSKELVKLFPNSKSEISNSIDSYKSDTNSVHQAIYILDSFLK